MEKIIYPNESGISIIHPTGGVEHALKDVPSGVKYKIIKVTDLPKEYDFRGAWEYDFTDSFDGVAE